MLSRTRRLARQISSCLTRCFIALLITICTLTTAQAQIWQEEFTNGVSPDTATWSYEIGNGCPSLCGWGNAELQYYTARPENVYITNGALHIVARPEAPQYNGYDFTSARIKTQDKLTLQYGTVEARIKVPDLGDGLWPAFWTLGNNWYTVGWPACGEIDVMEMGSSSAIGAGLVNRRVGSTAHWEFNNGNASYGESYDSPTNLDGSFHIYRMEWTPTAISTYIDNIPIWTIDISNPASFDGEEFHQPHFLILNLAVGGNFTGLTGSGDITAPLPAEYVIDYIRIFDNGSTILGGSSLEPPAPPPVAGTNLLANPGFESGTTGWTVNDNGGTVVDSSAFANTGTHSLLVDNTGAAAWSSPQALQSFAAEPGDVFNFQGYMRTPASITDGSFGLLKMVFRDSGGNDLVVTQIDVGGQNLDFPGVESVPFLDSLSPAGQWILTEAQGEAPAGTVEVLFYLLNVNPPGSTTAMYFDDIEARLLGEPVVPVALSAALVGNNIEISFPTQDGASYEVVYKNDVVDPTWTVIETITGDGTIKTTSYPATNSPGRAYAVQSP